MKLIKARLDKIMVSRGLAENSSKAKALIMAGSVVVNDKKIVKAGSMFHTDINIKLLIKNNGWVSRGGIKLDYALKHFDINIKNKVCIDLGASTGGFTDVLITRGAQHVYAADVGKSQLSWKLVSSDKVTILDKTNVRYLKLNEIDSSINFITCDLSFISLTKALYNILGFSNINFEILALVKPQFELEKHKIGKRGIVTDKNFRFEALQKVTNFLKSKNFFTEPSVESPIKGSKGNVEYFLYAKKKNIL